MAGSSLGEHKANVMAAHDSQDYGALAKHAKLLHTEAKSANRMMKADPIGGSSRKPMGGLANPYSIQASGPIGGGGVKPQVIQAPTGMPMGGGAGKKPRAY